MRRLARMPGSGRVAVGHPDDHLTAQIAALREGCDYFLDGLVPKGQVFVMDLDNLLEIGEQWTATRGGCTRDSR